MIEFCELFEQNGDLFAAIRDDDGTHLDLILPAVEFTDDDLPVEGEA